jgi:hypothetical protein
MAGGVEGHRGGTRQYDGTYPQNYVIGSYMRFWISRFLSFFSYSS